MNDIRSLIRITAFIILLTCISEVAKSQSTDSVFTLKSSIEYSLKNNPSSTIYNNEVEIARQKNIQALSTYLPQIAGNFTIDYNPMLQTNIITVGGMEQTLRFGQSHANGAVVQVDQKIYDQSAIEAISARKVNNEIAQLNILKNNEALIYNTSLAYYQVLIYKEQEKLLRENEKQYKELLDILKLQYDRGVIRKIDYDRTRVSANNITSQITLIQTNQTLALNRLKNAMGMPLETTIRIEDSSYTQTKADLPQAAQLNLENRLDYQIMNQNILAQEIDVRMKKAAFAPVLAAYARYGSNSFGPEFATSFNKWYDYSAIGVKLSVPIFSGFNKSSQLKQSRLALINARENAKLSMQNYKLDYENANTKLLSSYTSLNKDKENMELAKEVFETTNLQYRQGTASLTDFLNADYSLKEAQSNYINSLLNFMSARVDYEKSQGTLPAYINQL
ncbi:MAG: outer rane efflux protein [Cytophagaceae bacterium]|jgi:outer membrane protein TolC|nr:outer rane efflux protein [Cytophagaceae bacterium]